jgi:hypothetical protein
LINTSQQIGGALGLAVLSTIATSRTHSVLAGGSSLPHALTAGFQSAFIGGGVIAALGLAAALVLTWHWLRSGLRPPELVETHLRRG